MPASHVSLANISKAAEKSLEELKALRSTSEAQIAAGKCSQIIISDKG